jgi:hypothetical protein
MRYRELMTFSPEMLALLDRTWEVEIETRGPDGSAHRTIVWIVVDADEAFLRSYRGAGARWYREALADPEVAVHVDGRRVPARAVPTADDRSIARTSSALARKYAGDPSTPVMLRAEILETTLRIDPA